MDMKERPILFSTPMVKAINEDRKNMTRRIADKEISNHFDIDVDGTAISYIDQETGDKYPPIELCRFSVGDILWVRETWSYIEPDDLNPGRFIYKASPETYYPIFEETITWRPSIFMPREACRIRLKVKNVRVERLHEITEEDAKAEGITSYWAEPHRDDAPFIGAAKEIGEDLCLTRREAFRQLWDSLNKERGYGWDVNSWVWVIEFEKEPGAAPMRN
jgi:hypothetical protein